MGYGYLLAQHGREIEFLQLRQNLMPNLGEGFVRKPREYPLESWTVIKVFKGEEAGRLDGLISHIGLSNTKKLFELELLEVKASI